MSRDLRLGTTGLDYAMHYETKAIAKRTFVYPVVGNGVEFVTGP